MSEFSYNITPDFSNGVNQNGLEGEIKEVISTPFYIRIKGQNISIMFDSSLSTNDQTLLNNVIANHDTTSYSGIFNITTTIKKDKTYMADHFPDPLYKRICMVKESSSETFIDDSFTFNNGLTGYYTIDNPSIGDLSLNNYMLKGSTYIEGINISSLGTAYASSETQPASYAIDNNVNTFWYNRSTQPAVGSWWMIDFGEIKGIFSLEVVWYSTTYYGTDVSIQWSNDGSNWNLILRDQNVTYTSSGNTTGEYKFANFPNPIFARYFRILCNASNNPTFFILKEARFYEAIGSGFSTSESSTLETTDSLGKINTYTWATINNATIFGTFPEGTVTKLLLSFDSKNSWVYWNGSNWATENNVANSTMTPSVFNGLTGSNFSSVLNATSDTILNIKIYISTTDSAKSPLIGNIQFNVTTIPYRKTASDSIIQIRNMSSRKTEFKNISDEDKDFYITIYSQ